MSRLRQLRDRGRERSPDVTSVSLAEEAGMSIPERDWKVFRRLFAVALERSSQRVLDDCRSICAREGSSAHARYLELYELIDRRNREMGRTFDRFSRSSALDTLQAIHGYGLLTEAELREFSEETRRNLGLEPPGCGPR